MFATILVITARSSEMNVAHGYVIGAVIALFIMGYLIYSLIKPEKF
ncbi:MAG: K(+)-transporting ATPase subunit F [Bacteroidetes bacterium]|nr:K(+)-transporting ATPase subunit F [Bacteroidota bacterium]